MRVGHNEATFAIPAFIQYSMIYSYANIPQELSENQKIHFE
ncbi:hypothetical protein LEP1GSC034_4827 [Leptospira interrogans str. 2003000735]|uniref:Uncharacterized protein n=5 Tax=Leptospira interrogans TaxID=173 RepID=M3FKN1_LEPIR|nr:hypothetical protein [Leptospira interrogans]ALE40400.1 hypothetical protein G436_3242 [Leptospira interrogans serovar Hardjo str. Norma]EJP17820.1 hypothetical protein LEP1GSC080_4829 [Leptospira interrogans str. FPW2026]EKN89248.1 hypothetical protein LEP1GSC027_2111 [Leptospira interrogans str. 2002000624]EKO67664.1 hypothetical protein LEP1GSC069_1579 [Leptospira interrogans serovar Canicola str. Fiocruz LV133]EKO89361.1 hypothetical protein LEP1GSC009_2812 [Leptospira interrogans serov